MHPVPTSHYYDYDLFFLLYEFMDLLQTIDELKLINGNISLYEWVVSSNK